MDNEYVVRNILVVRDRVAIGDRRPGETIIGNIDIVDATGVTMKIISSASTNSSIDFGLSDVAPTEASIVYNPVADNLGFEYQGDPKFTIDATGLSIPGDLTVTGDLTVSGTTTTVDSTVVTIADTTITLNNGEIGAGVGGGSGTSGIEIDRGSEANIFWHWDETSDYWTPVGGDIGNTGTITATSFVGALTGNVLGDVTGTLFGDVVGGIVANSGTVVDIAGSLLSIADNQISGDWVDGGTISDFASTGIDDNASSVAITIDVNENIGVGVTSLESWGAALTAIQIGGNSTISSTTAVGADGEFNISQNTYNDGTNYRYQSTDEASRYILVDGTHRFFVGDLGNADDIISFTETLTVSNSAKVGILNSSPIWFELEVGGDIGPTADETFDIGSASQKYQDIYAVTFNGQATSCLYADLAERFASDMDCDVGSVVIFGGEAEITQSLSCSDTRVAGVISTAPALMMNRDAGSDKTHPYVALRGRVPCKVTGKIQKGDLLVTSDTPGHAKAAYYIKDNSHAVFAKALEDYNPKFSGATSVITVVVI